ncbi:hypothetical protein COB55_04260 [Candidatus Wolfebacteria bacterium]|nr:MAG: hypothetical protein COB55_04260 [Candidatus Wolfebacteria bacterium]
MRRIRGGRKEVMRSIGQFVSFINFFIEVMRENYVGEGFVDWLVRDGKNSLRNSITLLTEKFKDERLWYEIDQDTLMVKISDNCAIDRHVGNRILCSPKSKGWTQIGSGGYRMSIFLNMKKRGNVALLPCKNDDVYELISKNDVLHPSILDALFVLEYSQQKILSWWKGASSIKCNRYIIFADAIFSKPEKKGRYVKALSIDANGGFGRKDLELSSLPTEECFLAVLNIS